VKDEYRVKAVCSVCQKAFLARYNIGRRAKTCTRKGHLCQREVVKVPGKRDKIVTCKENCCRSRYRAGAAASSMDTAIDPRKVLDPEAFARALKTTERLPDPEGISIRFMAATGCRLGEIFLVRKEHFVWTKDRRFSVVKVPTLKRRGQGRPLRSIHLENGSDLAKELQVWLKKKRPLDQVFKVARRTLERVIEVILDKVKPDREALAHIFRHTRASQLVAAGAPLTYVRQQLGWSSLEMAKLYAHTSEDEIGGVFDRIP
jgi:integrase